MKILGLIFLFPFSFTAFSILYLWLSADKKELEKDIDAYIKKHLEACLGMGIVLTFALYGIIFIF